MDLVASSSTTSTDRLLGLPAELRDWIITLVVRRHGNYEPITAETLSRDATESAFSLTNEQLSTEYAITPSLPALALTCRQVYSEVAAVFYRENMFKLSLHTYHAATNFRAGPKVFSEWIFCPTRSKMHRKAMVASLSLISLAFPLSSWASDTARNMMSMGDLQRPFLHVSLGKGGDVRVDFTSKLQRRCTCQLDKMMLWCNEGLEDRKTEGGNKKAPNGLVAYVLELESLLLEPGFEDKYFESASKCCTCIEREREREPEAKKLSA